MPKNAVTIFMITTTGHMLCYFYTHINTNTYHRQWLESMHAHTHTHTHTHTLHSRNAEADHHRKCSHEAIGWSEERAKRLNDCLTSVAADAVLNQNNWNGPQPQEHKPHEKEGQRPCRGGGGGGGGGVGRGRGESGEWSCSSAIISGIPPSSAWVARIRGYLQMFPVPTTEPRHVSSMAREEENVPWTGESRA